MGAVWDLIAYDNLFLTLTCMHVFQTFFKSSFPSLYAMLLKCNLPLFKIYLAPY